MRPGRHSGLMLDSCLGIRHDSLPYQVVQRNKGEGNMASKRRTQRQEAKGGVMGNSQTLNPAL